MSFLIRFAGLKEIFPPYIVTLVRLSPLITSDELNDKSTPVTVRLERSTYYPSTALPVRLNVVKLTSGKS